MKYKLSADSRRLLKEKWHLDKTNRRGIVIPAKAGIQHIKVLEMDAGSSPD